jgi:uncharacterized protein (TIGR03437 family)
VLPPRFIAGLIAAGLHAQVSVLTYQYDNSRAGANTAESILTPSSVNAARFGKLFSYAVDGYVYAQPLYIPNVAIPGKGTHNVLLVATEHDSVYALDADSNSGPNSAPLWRTSFLGDGVTSFPAADTGCGQIVPEIGITGTPVVDPASGSVYLVAMTKETTNGSASYVARLHVLDIATGAERAPGPATITASSPGSADGGSTVTFQTRNHKQRPGLVLVNGTVYIAWSSHCDGGRYHGWLTAYDAQSFRQVAVYNSTPNGNMGAFWSGATAADSAGNIYLASGNGSFNYASGGPNLGESYIKLSTGGGLTVADYFTPFNYDTLNTRDQDVGSAGVVLLGDEAGSSAHPHLMAGAGKEGRIYLLDRDALGGLRSGSDSQIVQSIPSAIGALFGNPAYYNQTLYFCGASDPLKAFAVTGGQMNPTPRRSAATIPFPGCVPTISANGTSGGIVWVNDPGGLLRAFDAADISNELYNSNQNRARDAFGSTVKFSVPMAANGKVYAGTQSSVVAYGLLSSPARAAAANAASGDTAALAPGSLFSIYGTGLAPAPEAAGAFPLPFQLGGLTVTVNGAAAPLLYVSPGQVNAQVPYDTAPGPVTIAVMRAGQVIATANVTIQAAAPGLFLLAGRAAVLNPGGGILSAFVTGLGAVQPAIPEGQAASADPLAYTAATVTATINGIDAPVQFAGLAPGFAGLYQVNLKIPGLPPGDYPLVISAAGVSSNAATVSIR